MKKLFFYMLGALAIVAVASCDKKDPKQSDELLPDDGGTPRTEEQSKNYIEETGIAFLNAIDLEKWQADADLALSTALTVKEMVEAEEPGDEFDYDDVMTWFTAIMSSWVTVIDRDPEGQIEDYEWEKWAIKLSDVHGEFALDGNKLVLKNADYPAFILTAQINGEPVVIQAEVKDRSDKIRISDSYQTGEGWYYRSTEWLFVPTSVETKLSIGSHELVYCLVNLDFTDANKNGEVDPEEDSASASVNLKLGVFRYNLSQVKYSPTEAGISFDFWIGNTMLYSQMASAEYEWPETLKKVYTKFDILGKIQVVATCPDVQALMEEYTNQEASGTEEEMKAAIAKLNQFFGIAVYFDGGSTIQAKVVLDYYGGGAIPVLLFPDGTTYTVEEYFSGENFGALLDSAMQLAQKIMDHFGIYNEEDYPDEN